MSMMRQWMGPLAVMGTVLAVGLAASPVDASTLKAKSGKPSIQQSVASNDAAPAATSSVSEALNPGCQRIRRRLWIDGEGWLVRGVVVCR